MASLCVVHYRESRSLHLPHHVFVSMTQPSDHDSTDSPSASDDASQSGLFGVTLDEPESDLDTSDVSVRSMVIQTLVLTAALIGVVAVLAHFWLEPFKAFAQATIESLGMPGVLFGLWMTDTFTFPIPTDMYLAVAVGAEAPLIPTLIAICLVSMFAGNCGYFVGPRITKIGFIRRRVEAFRPRGEKLFARWGVWAVAIGALTPLPYSIMCWTAGIYKMPYRKFFWATFFRIPRMIAYYLIILSTWSTSAA